jgi:diguanylate cyclase (GGDEF)-like protein/PAS domain S-box-containing protein
MNLDNISITVLESLYNKERKFLENVFKYADAIIVAIDKNGTMVKFNQYAQDFTGYSEEEISSEPFFWQILLPYDIKQNLKEMVKKAQKGSITKRHVNSWISKSGEERVFEWSNSIIVDENNDMEFILSVGIDVTLQKKLSKKMDDYLSLIDEYIITSSTDLNGIITFASNAFCQTSGYSKEELVGKNFSILKHPDMDDSVYKELWQVITSGKKWEGEIKNRAKDGSTYWIHNIISPIFDKQNRITGYTSISQNITDKKRVEELSVTDSLTGLYNRLKLDSVLSYEISMAFRYDTPLSIIMLDIDHFKRVNDQYGHQVGDIVLQEFSRIIEDNARKVDIVGRWGGEEFLIILPQTEIKDALHVAEKLRITIEEFSFSHVGTKTCSFGVATYETGESDVQLVEKADTALYRAKKNGRNRVEYS